MGVFNGFFYLPVLMFSLGVLWVGVSLIKSRPLHSQKTLSFEKVRKTSG